MPASTKTTSPPGTVIDIISSTQMYFAMKNVLTDKMQCTFSKIPVIEMKCE